MVKEFPLAPGQPALPSVRIAGTFICWGLTTVVAVAPMLTVPAPPAAPAKPTVTQRVAVTWKLLCVPAVVVEVVTVIVNDSPLRGQLLQVSVIGGPPVLGEQPAVLAWAFFANIAIPFVSAVE
jgi:hypothetical protein